MRKARGGPGSPGLVSLQRMAGMVKELVHGAGNEFAERQRPSFSMNSETVLAGPASNASKTSSTKLLTGKERNDRFKCRRRTQRPRWSSLRSSSQSITNAVAAVGRARLPRVGGSPGTVGSSSWQERTSGDHSLPLRRLPGHLRASRPHAGRHDLTRCTSCTGPRPSVQDEAKPSGTFDRGDTFSPGLERDHLSCIADALQLLLRKVPEQFASLHCSNDLVGHSPYLPGPDDYIERPSGVRPSTAGVGPAYGSVLTRDGDCLGPVVNLAARIVGTASAGMIVMNEGLSVHVSGDGRNVTHSEPSPSKASRIRCRCSTSARANEPVIANLQLSPPDSARSEESSVTPCLVGHSRLTEFRAWVYRTSKFVEASQETLIRSGRWYKTSPSPMYRRRRLSNVP